MFKREYLPEMDIYSLMSFYIDLNETVDNIYKRLIKVNLDSVNGNSNYAIINITIQVFDKKYGENIENVGHFLKFQKENILHYCNVYGIQCRKNKNKAYFYNIFKKILLGEISGETANNFILDYIIDIGTKTKGFIWTFFPQFNQHYLEMEKHQFETI